LKSKENPDKLERHMSTEVEDHMRARGAEWGPEEGHRSRGVEWQKRNREEGYKHTRAHTPHTHVLTLFPNVGLDTSTARNRI
jgi:hypothetical protein